MEHEPALFRVNNSLRGYFADFAFLDWIWGLDSNENAESKYSFHIGKLLILDEASSALDAETEKKIQQNLLDSGGERMTIAVAHRLSTIRNANEILSMVDGVIVERGKHEELIKSQGVYHSQWNIQTGEIEK